MPTPSVLGVPWSRPLSFVSSSRWPACERGCSRFLPPQRLSVGSAGSGGGVPLLGNGLPGISRCSQGRDTSAPASRRASLWPDFSRSIVVANTKAYAASLVTAPALNYTPAHSLGPSLCGQGCVPSPANPGLSQKAPRQGRRAVYFPASLCQPHPPTYPFLFGPRLPFGRYEITGGGLCSPPPHPRPSLT